MHTHAHAHAHTHAVPMQLPVESKSHIQKVMFLCAVAKPIYDKHGTCVFDGKVQHRTCTPPAVTRTHLHTPGHTHAHRSGSGVAGSSARVAASLLARESATRKMIHTLQTRTWTHCCTQSSWRGTCSPGSRSCASQCGMRPTAAPTTASTYSMTVHLGTGQRVSRHILNTICLEVRGEWVRQPDIRARRESWSP